MDPDYKIIIQIGNYFWAKVLDPYCPYKHFLGKFGNGYKILFSIKI